MNILPPNPFLRFGESIRLECIAKPNAYTTEWTFNNETPTAKVHKHYLTVENAFITDAGVYRCKATTADGKVGTAAVILVVEPQDDVEMNDIAKFRISKLQTSKILLSEPVELTILISVIVFYCIDKSTHFPY